MIRREPGSCRRKGKLKQLSGDFEAGNRVSHKPCIIHSSAANDDEKEEDNIGK